MLCMSLARDHYLKGKAQYSIPPHLGSLSCEKRMYATSKAVAQNSWYKEVNCTSPSHSIRVP
jgi:hypothetical protein